MKLLFILPLFILFGCLQGESDETNLTEQPTGVGTKEHILLLERKWLEAEFALDTAYVSTLIDPTFIGISANRLANKQEELRGMFDNISTMRKDSIFLDSLKLEDAVINVYDNSAVATFIVHTYKKEKGLATEKRTRFYDVWINRSGKWKAVSSQGTTIASTN